MILNTVLTFDLHAFEQYCGSGFGNRCFFTPWIRFPDPGSNFFRIPYDIFLHFLQNPCYAIFFKLGYS
jgi:hypothetical protein